MRIKKFFSPTIAFIIALAVNYGFSLAYLNLLNLPPSLFLYLYQIVLASGVATVFNKTHKMP